jgi:hypothetical protein
MNRDQYSSLDPVWYKTGTVAPRGFGRKACYPLVTSAERAELRMLGTTTRQARERA